MGTGQQLRHKRPLIFTNPQAIAFRAGHAYPAQEPLGPGEYVTMKFSFPQFTIMDLVFVTMMVLVVTWSWGVCEPGIKELFNGQSPWELMMHYGQK